MVYYKVTCMLVKDSYYIGLSTYDNKFTLHDIEHVETIRCSFSKLMLLRPFPMKRMIRSEAMYYFHSIPNVQLHQDLISSCSDPAGRSSSSTIEKTRSRDGSRKDTSHLTISSCCSILSCAILRNEFAWSIDSIWKRQIPMSRSDTSVVPAMIFIDSLTNNNINTYPRTSSNCNYLFSKYIFFVP